MLALLLGQTHRYPFTVDFGLLCLRLVMGVAFIMHGLPKIQAPLTWLGHGVPPVLQALAAVSEFGGGIALILGLFVSLASLGLISTMTVAIVTVHLAMGHPFVSPTQGASYELAAIYLVSSLLLFFAGAGRWSIDALIARR